MSRVRYFISRVIQTLLLLFLILTFLFFLFRLMPGDYSDVMLFSGASQENIEAFRAKWGLNDPLYVQYFRFISNAAHGDFGNSIVYRESVVTFVKPKLINTFILVGPAITFSYLLGTVVGSVLGNYRGTKLETYVLLPIIAFGSIPIFFTGIVLIVIFAGFLDVLPPGGMVSVDTATKYDSIWRQMMTKDFAAHYIMPFTAVVIRYLYVPTTVMRTSLVEITGQDFIKYYISTGIPTINRLRHISKHAILPVITVYPVSMTRAIGGMVLLEVVFNWPGIGNTLVQMIFARDFPVVQFIFFLAAVFVVFGNFVVDILYGIIDPRVTIGDRSE